MFYNGYFAEYEIYESAAGTWCILADNGNYNDRKSYLGFGSFEEVYNFMITELEDGNIPEELEG